MVKKIIKKKAEKHGMTDTRLYTIWGGMIRRCYNRNHEAYDRYGGRGIVMCDDWRNYFSKFYNWSMENGYDDNLTIDRIDNNLGYFPENCRWVTRKEQSRNRITNRIIESPEKESKSIVEWCEFFGIDRKGYFRAFDRAKKGLPFYEIFFPESKSPKSAEKQSGIKGIIWNKKAEVWVVKSIKNGKPDTYLKSFKKLKDAKDFLEEYNRKLKI